MKKFLLVASALLFATPTMAQHVHQKGPNGGPMEDVAGVHVEITNLLIPGLNDSDGQVRALCHWMVDRGLQAVPLHFSRYFPRYRMREPEMTPKATLLRAKGIALEAGCETVYLGNV